MNDIKGIIEDVEKSDIVSDKVIKKVIEIIGQEKWQDINDELSDICTTTGELIITLKGIPDLEEENRALKSLLYCTKRSCNNCGKVNCENFQRQRIDCCGLWVSFKDYILDLKANFDLAIEGRDLKIKELELELTVEKDQHQEEINLHLHAEEYIKSLEQKLEQTEKDLADYQFNYPKIKELEKENAELKGIKDVATLIKANNDTVVTLMQLNNKLVSKSQQFTKAKALIENIIRVTWGEGWNYSLDWKSKAEQFIREIEK